MDNRALSYEQAPPFSAPLLLYLAAPAFLLATALFAIATLQDWLESRWNPASLAITHLLTLGFLGTAMSASLLQMLPVTIGRQVPAVTLMARLMLAGLSIGTPALVWGFLEGEPAAFGLAMLALAGGILPFLGGILTSLWQAPRGTLLRAPLTFSALGLAVTLGLGLWLAGLLGGHWRGGDPLLLTHLHVAWGLIAWVLVLVIGVAWQVVPMLQLTPTYPMPQGRQVVWALLIALLIVPPALLWTQMSWLHILAALVTAGSAAAFALLTLALYRKRRRKISDATLSFWRLGMAGLLLSSGLLALRDVVPFVWQDGLDLLIGLGFLLGFAVPVVNGMLYKIVPFLCWFHLQAQRMAHKRAGLPVTGSLPSMKGFVPDAAAQQQFQSYAAALPLVLTAPLLSPVIAYPGLILLVISSLQLWRNLWRAARLFRHEGGQLDRPASGEDPACATGKN